MNARSGMIAAAAAVFVGAAAHAALPCDDCTAERIAACGGFLEGAAISPSGELWMLDLTGDRILQVTDDGQCVERGKTGGTPNGAKFLADGRLAITSHTGLLVFDPADESLSVLADRFEGAPLEGLNDLIVDSSGGIYFTAPIGSHLANRDGRVFYLPAGAEEPILFLDGLAFPNGIALSANEQSVLIAEFGAKRVIAAPVVGATGLGLVHVYAWTYGGIGPDGLGVGPDNTLYAANFGTPDVLVYDPLGRPAGAISLPEGSGVFTTNVAIRGDDLFITEGQRGEVWRVRLRPQ